MYYSILLKKDYESLDLKIQCEKVFILGFGDAIKNNSHLVNIMSRSDFCKSFEIDEAYLKFIVKHVLCNENINFLNSLRNKLKYVSGQQKVYLCNLLKSKQKQIEKAFYVYFYYMALVHISDFSAQYFLDLFDYIYIQE